MRKKEIGLTWTEKLDSFHSETKLLINRRNCSEVVHNNFESLMPTKMLETKENAMNLAGYVLVLLCTLQHSFSTFPLNKDTMCMKYPEKQMRLLMVRGDLPYLSSRSLFMFRLSSRADRSYYQNSYVTHSLYTVLWKLCIRRCTEICTTVEVVLQLWLY